MTIFIAMYFLGIPTARSDCLDRPWGKVWQRVVFWPIFGLFGWLLIAMAFFAPEKFLAAMKAMDDKERKD